MIEVIFYKNGFEIKGHADREICSVVSSMAWACANSMGKIDWKKRYYTSVNDNPSNPNEGYTWCIFNRRNNKLNWIYKQFKHNVQMWCKELYPYDVKFNDNNKYNLSR